MKKYQIFIVFIMLFKAGLVAQQKIQVTDLSLINTVQNMQASKDGTVIIYSLKTMEPNKENPLEYDYNTQLWQLQGTVYKQITFGSESIAAFDLSPNGQQIAFVRSVKGKGQVFLLNLNGGEAQQITDCKYSIGTVQWQPTGTKLLLGTTVGLEALLKDSTLNTQKQQPRWAAEKPGFKDNSHFFTNPNTKPNPNGSLAEIRAYLQKNEEDKKAKVFNSLRFQTESGTDPELYFNLYLTINASAFSKIEPLLFGFQNYTQAIWSVSGQSIYYVSNLDPTTHPSRVQDQAIYNFDLKTQKNQLIIGKKGSTYQLAAVSEDGLQLAINHQPSQGVNFGQLAIMNSDGSDFVNLNFDRSATDIQWSTNSQNLYFTAPANGAQPLYNYHLKEKKIKQLSDNDSGITKYTLAGNAIIYAKTNIANPSEIYTNSTTFTAEKPLTQHNSWLKDRQLSLAKKSSFKNNLGQEIDYWIMPPTGLKPGQKYPLLLNMHGGPTAMWGPGEQSMWHEHQYFCAQGYGVVYANPRGSGGYGLAFQQANTRDWGTGPAADVLQACTLASRQPWVDSSQLVLTGGSYAGYLTAWIVGHDHRFKAAFAQRGVYELSTFMGEGNAWALVPNYFGLPWQPADKAILDRESPYSYVKDIKTPLLIKHGENDLRTGVIQSEMLYKSMKYLNKEVEYVRMPGGTHELSRTGNVHQRIDRILRMHEFFQRYIGKKQP
jgi:dipeptidyl aminopeptidase/acylaminoacyl peptidase